MAYQRRFSKRTSNTRRSFQRKGKVFRTRSGRLGRYVYKHGVKVGFKAVQSGARRYVADRTYRSARKRWG